MNRQCVVRSLGWENWFGPWARCDFLEYGEPFGWTHSAGFRCAV